MKKVIICGYNLVGCEVLKIIYEKNFELFVYTHESPHFIPDLVSYCKELNIPHSTDKITIKNLPFKPDIICSIYYRYIIAKDIIDITEGKIFNLHPYLNKPWSESNEFSPNELIPSPLVTAKIGLIPISPKLNLDSKKKPNSLPKLEKFCDK